MLLLTHLTVYGLSRRFVSGTHLWLHVTRTTVRLQEYERPTRITKGTHHCDQFRVAIETSNGWWDESPRTYIRECSYNPTGIQTTTNCVVIIIVVVVVGMERNFLSTRMDQNKIT